MNHLKAIFFTFACITSLNTRSSVASSPQCQINSNYDYIQDTSVFKEKTFCLAKYLANELSLNLDKFDNNRLYSKSNIDTLISNLNNLQKINYFQSILCNGSNLAHTNFMGQRTHDISFCPEELELIQRAIRYKYDQATTEKIYDEIIIAILVHEGLHMDDWSHSKKMFKTVTRILKKIGYHSLQNNNGKDFSKWFYSKVVIDKRAGKIKIIKKENI